MARSAREGTRPCAPTIEAARHSPALARRLALVDTLRLGGGARLERRAAELLAGELRVPDVAGHIGAP